VNRILITGAAGAIGRTLREGLGGVYPVLRLADVKDLGPAGAGEEVRRADLSDMAKTEPLMDGVDAVVHLAATLGSIRKDGKVVGENPWEKILPNNIVGTYNVFEAARRCKVKRIVYASSIHAHGFYRRTTKIRPDSFPRPDSRYGLSKAFGEALGRYYADKFGLEVVALRIATFKAKPESVRDLGTWISPGDMVRLARAALDCLDVHFDVLWGVSANKRALYDNPNAKRFGYFPEDDSEVFRDAILRARKGEAEPPLERMFHAAILATPEFAGDVSKIT
jgi:uronate dehydrogenase